MKWLRNRYNRMLAAMLAAVLLLMLVRVAESVGANQFTGMWNGKKAEVVDKSQTVNASDTEEQAGISYLQPAPPILAWWGSLYPKFCFSQIPAGDDEEGTSPAADNGGAASESGAAPKLKISFWLAKAFDWC